MENITEWVTRVTDGESWRTIAARLGTTHPTIQRRLKNDTASAVVEIADSYGVNPVAGLLAAGSITQGHIDAFARSSGIDSYDDLELAEEMVKRIQERQSSPLATVTEFPGKNELSERRSMSTTPDVEDMPEDAVADSSADHPEEDNEFD